MLHLNELNQLKYTVKFAAKTIQEMLEYFTMEKDFAFTRIILNALGTLCCGFLSYKFFQAFHKRLTRRK